MLYVISYDVVEDAGRRRIYEALKDYGRRVQYSVFESDLDRKGLEELCGRLEEAIDPAADSCRIYRICEACAKEVQILGRGDRYERPGYLVV